MILMGGILEETIWFPFQAPNLSGNHGWDRRKGNRSRKNEIEKI